MEKVALINNEKIIITLRDSTWVLFLYIVLRVAITTLFTGDIDLNVSLSLFEKVIGVIVWAAIICLSYYTSKVHKEIKNKYGKLLLLTLPKETAILSIIAIILVEIYVLIR